MNNTFDAVDDHRCSLQNIRLMRPFPRSTHRKESELFNDVVHDECWEESRSPRLDGTTSTKVFALTLSKDLSAHVQTNTTEPIVNKVE